VAERRPEQLRHGRGDVVAPGGHHRVDRRLCLALGPAEADERDEDVGGRAGGGGDAGRGRRDVELAGQRQDDELRRLGPMPETRRNAASSSSATAWATCDGLRCPSTPWALFGPTPVTLRSRSKTSSSSRSAKPKRERSSSRTTRAVWSIAVSPGRRVRASWAVTPTRRPTPPTSTTTVVPEADSTVPRTDEIMPPA
jgi:hypothetical protein